MKTEGSSLNQSFRIFVVIVHSTLVFRKVLIVILCDEGVEEYN